VDICIYASHEVSRVRGQAAPLGPRRAAKALQNPGEVQA
jgi:hypothetical protein